MPGKGKSKDKYLRIELDTENLYNAFQEIKNYRGIRSNSDVLRFLILNAYYKIKVEKEVPDQTPFGKYKLASKMSFYELNKELNLLIEENERLKKENIKLRT